MVQHTLRAPGTRLACAFRIAAVFAATTLAIAAALPVSADDAATIWTASAKTMAKLQAPTAFDAYTIQLPAGFTAAKPAASGGAQQSEWVGPLRPDGSRAEIDVQVSQLTPDQAMNHPIATGCALLESRSKQSTTRYVRSKNEIGMIDGNWVTRFDDTGIMVSGSAGIPVRGENFVWIDQGRLLMASISDSTRYIKTSLPLMEAAIYSISPAQAGDPNSAPGSIPSP